MNEDKYRDVTMTALPLFWVPFTQFRSAKQWWIVFILEVYHVRNGRGTPRSHSRVPPEQHAAALSCHPQQWGSIPQFRNYLKVKFGIKLWCLLSAIVLKSLAAVSRSSDAIDDPKRRGHGHWMETGNESGIGFEDDLSSPTNFFLGRIRV